MAHQNTKRRQTSAMCSQTKQAYQNEGFFKLEAFTHPNELTEITRVVERFHEGWQEANPDALASGAINSAWLTAPNILGEADRSTLFAWLGSQRLNELLSTVLGSDYAFMNTQLFFDPLEANQRNYWHRDTQYDKSPEEQKAALSDKEVIHCRLALKDEPGIELVPGSHRRWDTRQELETRLGQNGRKVYDALPDTQSLPLQAGDLLVFSANMIHRGLYGKQRLALDSLFFQSDTRLGRYVRPDCLPSESQLKRLDCAKAFRESARLLASAGTK